VREGTDTKWLGKREERGRKGSEETGQLEPWKLTQNASEVENDGGQISSRYA